MRKTSLLLVILSIFIIMSHACADGAFFGERSVIVPKSSDKVTYAGDITEPTQKAILIYCKGIEQLALEVSFKGDASKFAWLVPTPAKPEVTKIDQPLFHDIHNATLPEVKYWLDSDLLLGDIESRSSLRSSGYLSAGSGGAPVAERKHLDVEVLDQKPIGQYDIAVLRAGNEGDLLEWLTRNGYAISPSVSPVLTDYIHRGWVFTAMRVNTAYQASAGERLSEGVLQSLSFKFKSSEPIYPLKISSLNKGKTDVLIYLWSDIRYDEPLLKTEWSVDSLPFVDLDDIVRIPDSGHTSGVSWTGRHRLTKFTASFAPEQMSRDLLFKSSATNEVTPIPPISPPPIDNLGMLSLLILACVTSAPVSAGVTAWAFFLAVSRMAKRSGWTWVYTAAICAVVNYFAFSGGLFASLIYKYCVHEQDFRLWGIAAFALVAVLGLITFVVVKSKRPTPA
jgi:hypothetical protein